MKVFGNSVDTLLPERIWSTMGSNDWQAVEEVTDSVSNKKVGSVENFTSFPSPLEAKNKYGILI